MPFEPSTRAPRRKNGAGVGKSSTMRGDGFTGGCISLIVLLIEIPVAYLLGLTSVIRGMGSADRPTAAPAMDCEPGGQEQQDNCTSRPARPTHPKALTS
ncbi:hypothetical protein [Streptomyces rubrogriseus]|uniref:Uncharacterized protein n=1 Tax=Streptomyces rubrogriseus TaxID=194673 RepID=A0A6G3TKK9_9ACTN|nr:hypothetical protein [Streptomyces rubrogriseus]NEC36838.1 hypothetical protein [Streptomyces rubrogriseus]